MTLGRLQKIQWETCAFIPLSISSLSDSVFRPQLFLIHTVANSVSVNPVESALTKSCATVSKYASSNPVESALTKTTLATPLDSTLTKNRGVGGEGYLVRQQRAPGPGSGLQMPGQREESQPKQQDWRSRATNPESPIASYESRHCSRSRAIESRAMLSADSTSSASAALANLFNAADVSGILRERGWLGAADSPETSVWCERAAALLGPHAANRDELAELLGLVFHYDARELAQPPETHSVLAREGARLVIRHLALLVLEGGEVDSERFKEIITALKERVGFSGRGLFHPIRLALAGRAGDGELDRVILLLDPAARAGFAIPVKGARQRMLEFCAALD